AQTRRATQSLEQPSERARDSGAGGKTADERRGTVTVAITGGGGVHGGVEQVPQRQARGGRRLPIHDGRWSLAQQHVGHREVAVGGDGGERLPERLRCPGPE